MEGGIEETTDREEVERQVPSPVLSACLFAEGHFTLPGFTLSRMENSI